MIIDPFPAIRHYLRSSPTIVGLVGERIQPLVLPQGTTADGVTYQVIDRAGDTHFQGTTGFTEMRLQLSAYSLLRANAERIANLIQDRIEGFRGEMVSPETPTPAVTVAILGCRMIFARQSWNDATKVYGEQRDYLMHYWGKT